ncbi:hypothetical protein M501DRAFT_1016001 [Patellaria atrata CBS 101060]|uniref:Uncharacterized protein n=1 Tax=Patellaria atrata CBS 101060 TaxID=1346257 RepID=A0A9P4SDP2_9PEZI|nr:hypothetical protein M501DRAFT_1016001 [Patellaria atrata CBS 101060]
MPPARIIGGPPHNANASKAKEVQSGPASSSSREPLAEVRNGKPRSTKPAANNGHRPAGMHPDFIKMLEESRRKREAAEAVEQAAREKHERELDAEKDYVTIGRPWWDWSREHDLGFFSDTPKEKREELTREYEKQRVTYSNKPSAEFPEWKWVMSKRATLMLEDFDELLKKRDPDEYDVYFGSNFFGYGVQEVIDTHMQSFFEEYRKGNSNTLLLWSYMEAMAFFLAGGSGAMHAWYMCDDSERNFEQLLIIGVALLTMLNTFEKEI